MNSKQKRLKELADEMVVILDELHDEAPQHIKAFYKGPRVYVEKALAVINIGFEKDKPIEQVKES